MALVRGYVLFWFPLLFRLVLATAVALHNVQPKLRLKRYFDPKPQALFGKPDTVNHELSSLELHP